MLNLHRFLYRFVNHFWFPSLIFEVEMSSINLQEALGINEDEFDDLQSLFQVGFLSYFSFWNSWTVQLFAAIWPRQGRNTDNKGDRDAAQMPGVEAKSWPGQGDGCHGHLRHDRLLHQLQWVPSTDLNSEKGRSWWRNFNGSLPVSISHSYLNIQADYFQNIWSS